MSAGRQYPARPIPCVGGLAFRDSAVLLVQRAKDPGRGMWSIPGGAVKTGETLVQALQREMMEEVGLEVEVGPLVEVIDRIVPDDDGRILYHYIIMDYLCYPASGEEPRHGSDAAAARFVTPDEWPAYQLPEFSMVVLNKARRMWEEK